MKAFAIGFKIFAVALMVCGVALVAYNLVDFQPFREIERAGSAHGIKATGMFYPKEVRFRIASGAVLLAAGILLYRHRQK